MFVGVCVSICVFVNVNQPFPPTFSVEAITMLNSPAHKKVVIPTNICTFKVDFEIKIHRA